MGNAAQPENKENNMKFEIDLNDILGDEYDAETLQDSVRRQVIENLTRVIKEDVGKSVDSEVSKILNDEIRTAVTPQMPNIVQDLLETALRRIAAESQALREKNNRLREALLKIQSQAQRKQRASGAKHLLDGDLNIIERIASAALTKWAL